MFFSLISKEVRNHLLTFRFAAALLTIMALVIVSLWVLGDDYVRRRDAHNLAVENTERQNYEVYVPSQISPVLHRPPSKLSIFVQGDDRRFGNSLRVRRWEVPRRAESSFTDNMLMAAQQALDINIIIAVSLSLFGILFSYDAVSGERERGTLKLQCVSGVSRGSVYIAKFLGAVICLALPFLISFAGGLLLLSFFFGLTFSASQWTAVAAIVLAGLLYGALFVALGLACSSLVRRSSVALVLSLLIWVLSALVIPVSAQSLAGVVMQLPHPSEVSNLEKATERDAVDKLAEFKEDHPNYDWGWSTSNWTLPSNGNYLKFDGMGAWFRQGEDYVRFVEPIMLERADKIWNLYNTQEQQRAEQASLVELISFPSPAFHLRKTLSALAATDYDVYARFLDSERQYRRQMISDFEKRDYFGDRALQFFCRREKEETTDEAFRKRYEYYQQQLASGKRFEEFVGIDKWGVLPPEDILPFTSEKAEPDFASAIQPMSIPAIMLVIVVLVGFIAFIRYDVR